MLLAPVKLKDNVHFRGAFKHYKCEIKWLKLVQESSSSNILFLGKSPSVSFGWPTIAVDTHIFRVSNRTKLAMGKDVVAVEQKLEKVIPKEFKVDVHHWLILHGRYTCVARKPKCGSCIIEDLCEFKDKTD